MEYSCLLLSGLVLAGTRVGVFTFHYSQGEKGEERYVTLLWLHSHPNVLRLKVHLELHSCAAFSLIESMDNT